MPQTWATNAASGERSISEYRRGSTISETLRILISNGIILYALTKSGGDSRG